MAKKSNTNHLYIDENDGKDYLVFYSGGLICFPYSMPTDEYANKSLNTVANRTMWGTYDVDKKNNTIKSQTILDMGKMSDAWVEYKNFEVISSTQIRLTGSQVEGGKYFIRNIIYDYHPFPERMDSTNCWLLKKKWFWTKEAWEMRDK